MEFLLKRMCVPKRGDLVDVAPAQDSRQRRQKQNIPSKKHVKPLETITTEAGREFRDILKNPQ